MVNFPKPHPYGIMVSLGFLSGWAMAVWRFKRHFFRGDPEASQKAFDKATDVALVGGMFGFLGAKLMFLWAHRHELDSLWRAFLSSGGFVFFGGVIGAILALFVYARYTGIPFLYLTDLLSPSLSLGHAIGRIGCFLNGCCYGIPVGSCCAFLGAYCAHTGNPAIDMVKRYPTQLFESTFLFILTYILVKFGNVEKRGHTTGLYFVSYGVWRFLIEFIRGDDRGTYFAGLWISQWIALAVAIMGLVLLFRAKVDDKQEKMKKAMEDRDDS